MGPIKMKPRDSSTNPRKLVILVAVLAWANSNASGQALRGNPSHNNDPWPYDHLPAYVPKVADPTRLSEPLTFSQALSVARGAATKREAFRNANPTAPSSDNGVKRQQWPPAFPNNPQQAFSWPSLSPEEEEEEEEEEEPMYDPTYMYEYPDANSRTQEADDNVDNGSNEPRHPGRYPEHAFQWRRLSP